MFKTLLLMILVLLTSCMGTTHISHKVNIDQAIAIPKNLAAQYSNKLTPLNGGSEYEATFNENHVLINREKSFAPSIPIAIKNKPYTYSDLFVIAEVLEITGTFPSKNYHLALIHKDDLHSPELYVKIDHMSENHKFLRASKCLYVWYCDTKDLPEEDFTKFVNAMVSLGVKVAPQNP